MNPKHLLATALLAGVLASPGTSPASTRMWGQPQSGPFDTTGHQWNVVPGVNDIARFTNYASGSAFTVTLTQNVTNQYVRVDGGNPFEVTLDLAGYTYTASTNGNVVGRDSGDSGDTLKLTGGGIFSAQDFTIGNSANSSGKVILAGATLLQTAGEVVVGAYGSGALEITGGAAYSSQDIVRVGRRATGVGTVTVSGTGSRWDAAKEVFIGSSVSGAQGALTVEKGAKMATTSEGSDGAINLAQMAGTSATVLVTGKDSELSTGGALAIGGTRGGVEGGQAHLTVTDQAAVKATSNLFLYSAGILELDGGEVTARQLGSDTVAARGAIRLHLNDGVASIAALRFSQGLYLDTATATLTFSLADGVSLAAAGVIHLIDYKGTLTGSFSNYSEGQIVTLGDSAFSFSYTMGVEGNRFIGLAAVPEPGSVGLVLMGGVLAGVAAIRFNARRKS